MQPQLENVWHEAKRLDRVEQLELLEKLSHQLREEYRNSTGVMKWEDLYGIGKGLWEMDAQEYVTKLREERS